MTARDVVSGICVALRELGVEYVFGLPGTQNLALFEGFRTHRLRTVLATDERSAAFMANGYYRASGRVAALATIPGPGFAYAVAGLAQARLDSTPLLYLVGQPATMPGRAYQLQAIDQRAIAAPLVKACVDLGPHDDPASTIRRAHTLATTGGPGPVMVHLDLRGAARSAATIESGGSEATEAPKTDEALDELARLFASAVRPVFYVGSGAYGAASRLERLATSRRIPVLTTPSARGLMPEDGDVVIGFDPVRHHVDAANRLLRESDLVVALGCKLGHSGSAGFELRLSPEKLVHVDADPKVPGANYPTRLSIIGAVEDVVPALERRTAPSAWRDDALAEFRRECRTPPASEREPIIHGERTLTPAEFFEHVRALLPRDAIVVADSGLHQTLTRRHMDVVVPRGLLFPSDLQSVGFGVPAAIGAKLAAPRRPVVAIVGDGGLRMSGLELATARREHIPLAVMVFNDGYLGRIRAEQQREFGHAHAVDLSDVDYAALAAAMRIDYLRFDSASPGALRDAFVGARTTLIEVVVGDSAGMLASAAAARARSIARAVVPNSLRSRLRATLGRR